MQSIDLIRDDLAKGPERVLARVEDMRGHCLVPPTPRGGAHTLWVLGHLAFIEGLVVHQFALGGANPRADWKEAFDGEEVPADAGAFPPFDDVLRECRAARRETLAILDSLSEEDLDRPAAKAPEGFEDMFGTLRHCFRFASDHWHMHRGQLADARRAAGIRRMGM